MISSAILNNFASGELSNNLWARTDRPFYKTGLEVCRNFIPKLTGGLLFRPGSVHSANTLGNKTAWGLPYRFNLDQSYSLEFTDYKMRVHTDGGVILEDAVTITGVTQADPAVVTATGHGYSSGDEVFISGILGMADINSQFFLVVYIDANSFSLTDVYGNAIDSTSFAAYASGGEVAKVYEIASPYSLEEAQKIKYAGDADLMYMTMGTREPRVLIRAGNTSWSINTYTRYSGSKVITNITNASPGVVTSDNHGFVTNDRIHITHVTGMDSINETEYLVVFIDANTFSLKTLAGAAVNTSSYAAYESGGDISLVRLAPQSITGITQADPGVVTIASHGLPDKAKLYVYDVAGMTELTDGFYWVKYIDANTFSLTDELGNDLDTSLFSAYTGSGKIEFINGLFTKIGNFPRAVGFYDGSQFMGGSDNDPALFYKSMGPDLDTGGSQYDNYTTGEEANSAVSFELASQNDTVDQILWFKGTSKFMGIGTTGGVYKANGGADSQAITPTNISVVPISSVAVADSNPIFINNQIYYLQEGFEILRSFGYSLVEDEYKAYDKVVLAEDITKGGVKQLAYTRGRPELVWAVRNDGALLSCTILENEEVAGWARQPLGGDVEVVSVFSEPRSDGTDMLGIFGQREIDGGTRTFVEYISQDPVVPDSSDYFTGEENEKADRETFEKIVFEKQKQFIRLDGASVLDTSQEDISLTLSAVTGLGVTATASASLFTANDVGKFIFVKFLLGTEDGIAQITGYTSATVVTVNIRQDFDSVSIAAGGWYLATTSVGGLRHWEGDTLQVIADGAVHPDVTVSEGRAPLDYPCRYIILGKKYTGFIRTPDIEVPVTSGTPQAKLRNMEDLYLKLKNTLGGKVGTDAYHLAQLDYFQAGRSYYDRPPTLFTGLKEAHITDRSSNEKKIVYVQDQALPCEILAFIPSIDVGEEE